MPARVYDLVDKVSLRYPSSSSGGRMAGISQQLRMGPTYYRNRIKEREQIHSTVEDTGKKVEVDESEFHRAVLEGQMAEATSHLHFMENYVKPNEESENPIADTRIDEVMAKAREITEGGNLPRQKPLLYRLDFHRMDLERLKGELGDETDEARRVRLRQAIIRLEGKIEECVDWLIVQDAHGDWGTLVVGKEGREPKMPVFGTRTEVELAIANRHLPMDGVSAEDLKAGRISRYKQDAERIISGIDRAGRQ